jgi:hypothetical protein
MNATTERIEPTMPRQPARALGTAVGRGVARRLQVLTLPGSAITRIRRSSGGSLR